MTKVIETGEDCGAWASSWLRGTASTSPEAAKRQLAAAILASLRALL